MIGIFFKKDKRKRERTHVKYLLVGVYWNSIERVLSLSSYQNPSSWVTEAYANHTSAIEGLTLIQQVLYFGSLAVLWTVMVGEDCFLYLIGW